MNIIFYHKGMWRGCEITTPHQCTHRYTHIWVHCSTHCRKQCHVNNSNTYKNIKYYTQHLEKCKWFPLKHKTNHGINWWKIGGNNNIPWQLWDRFDMVMMDYVASNLPFFHIPIKHFGGETMLSWKSKLKRDGCHWWEDNICKL